MPQPTLLDAFILLALVGSVLSACHRGLAREMLHTVMFGVMVVVGYFFLKDTEIPKTPPELAKVMISCSFYLAAMYVFMWGAMKVLSPLILSHHIVGIRSRFWAGALSALKLAVSILGLNLWFAIQSPDAHPLRLEAFPLMVRESVLVQLSDRKTDEIYRWLASQNILDYNKFMEKPKTEAQQDQAGVGDILLGKALPAGATEEDIKPSLY